MSVRYYDTERSTAEIVGAIVAIDDVIAPSNNGKVLCVENGKIKARSVSSFSGEVVLEPLNVTANGDYYPSSGTDGFDEVHVNVPSGITAADEGKVVKNGVLVAQTVRATEITANGTYDTTENNSVTVNVSSGGSGAVVQPLSVTQNGTYNPPSGVDGFSPVTVNVSGGGGGGAGPIYYGTSTPSASVGNDEDLYIQYEIKSALYDHTYGIIAQYRKVNNTWEQYTVPALSTKGAHIWTKDASGSNAAMYVQNGYWDYFNNTFVATGEIESILYTDVRSWDAAKDCNGVALLAYLSKWQIKASTTVTDGTNTYQANEIVAQWNYNAQRDIYVYKPQG